MLAVLRVATLPTSLRMFDVSYNYLKGTLPSGMEALGNLTLLDLHANEFTGTLPARKHATICGVACDTYANYGTLHPRKEW